MPIIKTVACFHIAYRDPNDFGRERQTLLIRIETTDGIVGWGESIAMWSEACKATRVVIEEGLMPLLIGAEADPATLWSIMRKHVWWYGEGGIASFAISGIDMALWDIKGRAEGKPLYQLFGGLKHDRLPVCASCHVNKRSEAERVAEVVGFFAAGFKSTKLGFGKKGLSDIGTDPDRIVGFVAAVRRELGDGAEILVDIGNGIAWDVATAADVANRLIDLGIDWYEEPLYPTDDDDHAQLRRLTKIPIAAGEREFTVAGYRRMIRSGNVDILGVDPARVEGITGFRAVDALAGAAGLTMNAHAWSTAITSAASLHLSLASANTRLFEFKPFDVVVQTDLVADRVWHDKGWTLRLEGPGLGISVNEDVVRRLARS